MQKGDKGKKRKHVRLLCYFFLHNSAIAMKEGNGGIKHTGNKDFNSRLKDSAKLLAEFQRQSIPAVEVQAVAKTAKKRKP